MATIGERIRIAMDAAGLNQKELGDRVGVSKQAIGAMIKGKTKSPTPANVFAIADATGFEARWITTGKGPMTRQEAAMDRLDISMLSPQSQAAIRAALHAFAQQEHAHNGDDCEGISH